MRLFSTTEVRSPQNGVVLGRRPLFLCLPTEDQTNTKLEERDALINRKRCSCQHVPGYPPFYDDNPFGIYEKILSGKLEWPRHVEMTAKDLVKRLLVQDRTKRLGCMKAGAEDIKRHRFSSLSSSIRSSSSSLRTTRSTGGLVKIQGLFKKQLIEIE